MDKKKELPALPDQLFKRVQMIFEGRFAFRSSGIARIGLFSDELLRDEQVLFLLECLDMAGEIAVCNIQQLFERSEFHGIVDHEYRHDPQPDAMIEGFTDM